MEDEWWLLWIFSLCVASMAGFFLFKDRAQKANRAAARDSLQDDAIDNELLPPVDPPQSPALHKSSMVWTGDQQLPANEVYRPSAEWSPTSPMSPSSPALLSAASPAASSSSTDVAHHHRRARLVIVAKHLPINVIANGDDWRVEWDDARSFLSNLRSLQETGMDVTWVGMPPPGIDTSTAALQNKLSAALATHHCVPVFIEPTLCETFIKGFCKTVLWPLFHYVIPRARHGFAQNWDVRWDAYQKANELFAIAVATALGGDGSNHAPVSVWVQNYQLLLVPSYLRTRLPRARIGLFLHTPFPSSDLLRLLPAREALLRGIMCADLLGFYTYDYARHFLSCLKRVLNLDWETLSGGALGIKYAGRQVSIRISHVGIDSQAFADAAKSPAVIARAAEIRAKFHPRRIIIGMDDLDEVKGSVLKLQAYDRFLTNHSEWRDKVVLFQVILPTRHTFVKPPELILPLKVSAETKTGTPIAGATVTSTSTSTVTVTPAAAAAVIEPVSPSASDDEDDAGSDVKQGWFMKTIDEIRVNHGSDVIHVMDSSVAGNDLTFTETVALYAAASVAVVSTFWDGLNVIPYQFSVATSMDDPGALVVSEFMGCSRSLSGTIRVNPWAVESVGDAIHQALSMSLEERKANHLRRYNYVMSQSLKAWAQGFVEHLGTAAHSSDNLVFAQVGTGAAMRWVGLRADFHPLDMPLLTSCYTATKAPRGSSHPTRVFLLDYDGTLTSTEKDPEKNKMKGPSASLKRSLRTLCSDPSNCVFIIAGRQRSVLTTWFHDIPELGLAAEKGTFIRWPQSRSALFRATGPARVSTPSLAPIPSPYVPSSVSTSPLLGSRKEPSLMAPAFPPLSLGHSATTTTRHTEHTESSSYRERKDSMDNERMVNAQWETMVPDLEVRWKQAALQVLKEYTSHTDGSWIEDKEFAIVWHYARADPEYGKMQATELQKYLVRIFPADEVDVIKYDYNHILELKPHGINKGNTAAFILRTVLAPPPPPPPVVSVSRTRSLSFSRSDPPVIPASPPAAPLLVCIGDDRSDEDMFRAVHRRDDLRSPTIGPTGLSITSPGNNSNRDGHHHGNGSNTPGNGITSRPGSGSTTPIGGHSRRPSSDEPFSAHTFSICVGIKPSCARFYVHDSDEVGRVLASLAATGARAPIH